MADIQLSGFSNLTFLGEGAFGKVYCGRDRSSGMTRAIKVLPLGTSAMERSARAEIKALTRLPKHPNIIRCTRCLEEDTSLCIVMEYCTGGNLNDYLLSHQADSSRDLRFMREIASAVAFLHHNGVVHRDLKPDNILLASNGTLKVADFGLAKLASDSQHGGSLYNYYMATQCGSMLFLAPEVFNGRFTEKADVFSMGIIFACILQRTVLNCGNQRLVVVYARHRGDTIGIGQALYTGSLERYCLSGKLEVSQGLRNLIESMLDKSHHNRPTAGDVETRLGTSGQPSTETNIGQVILDAGLKGVAISAVVTAGMFLLGTLFGAKTEAGNSDSDSD